METAAKKIYSTNDKIDGDRNFSITIENGVPMVGQVTKQVVGVDAKTDEVVALHSIPGVGSSVVAFLRGCNNTFPTIMLAGPDRVNQGSFDLHHFRHDIARLVRVQLLKVEDKVPENAAIVIDASGRGLPEHQVEQIKKLSGCDGLVVVSLNLGQAGQDYQWADAGSHVLTNLTAALEEAGIGKSITNRPVIVTTVLSPINAILTVALQAICESWCFQPVSVRSPEGVFNFTELFNLAEMEDMGRNAAAAKPWISFGGSLPDGAEAFIRKVAAEYGLEVRA